MTARASLQHQFSWIFGGRCVLYRNRSRDHESDRRIPRRRSHSGSISFLRILRRTDEHVIPLSRPDIGPLEWERVRSVLLSGRLSLGPALEEFETRMARLCGTRHAVAVSSGTAALHMIVRALGIGDDDEVITTPYSFVASANAALFERARPVFVDIDPKTFNIDVGRIEQRLTPHTKAILAVDVFGLPADWIALEGIAARHELLLIDDACEALGAELRGRPVGAWGNAAAFGFYPNKQITTGEGGCITTNDDRLADLFRSLANQGRASRERMHHVRLGYNYRLDEMSAALGCAQLERFESLQESRRAAADAYTHRLAALEGMLELPPHTTDGVRSWFAYVVKLSDEFDIGDRDRVIVQLEARGIQSSAYFHPIHTQPLYREYGFSAGTLPNTERVSARTFAIPFFTGITDDQIDRVCAAVAEIVRGLSPRARIHPAA